MLIGMLMYIVWQIAGGDVDEHGCRGSAGYEWCEPLKQCIRSWITDCPENSH
jgi:hypothetical protein